MLEILTLTQFVKLLCQFILAPFVKVVIRLALGDYTLRPSDQEMTNVYVPTHHMVSEVREALNAEINALTATQFGALSAMQIGALTVPQIRGLSAAKVAMVPAATPSTSAARAVTGDRFPKRFKARSCALLAILAATASRSCSASTTASNVGPTMVANPWVPR